MSLSSLTVTIPSTIRVLFTATALYERLYVLFKSCLYSIAFFIDSLFKLKSDTQGSKYRLFKDFTVMSQYDQFTLRFVFPTCNPVTTPSEVTLAIFGFPISHALSSPVNPN